MKKLSLIIALMLGTLSFASDQNAKLNKINSERAKQIVLVRIPDAKLQNVVKFEDNGETYKGEISHGGKKYNFEINAFTGRILKWETK